VAHGRPLYIGEAMMHPNACFGYITILISVMNVQEVQAMKDACKGTFDLLGSAQEMILLVAAFTVGWHLIGPFLGKLLKLLQRCLPVVATPESGRVVSTQESFGKTAASGSQGSTPIPRRSKPLASKDELNFVETWLPEVQVERSEYDAGAVQACLEDNELSCRLRCHRNAHEGSGHGQIALARRLLKRRDIQGAEKCLQNIEYPIDFKTRKLFIVACSQTGNMDLGTRYFQQLQSDGFNADFAIYSAIIRGFCNVGKVEEAFIYLELMLEHKLQPDAMLVDALLEGCVSRNLFPKADRILKLMKDLGIQFSNTTLAACIKLYSSRGEINRCYGIFEEVVQTHHLQPNSYVYGALIAAALRNGKPELALDTYDAADCTPCARTYEHLVQCCIQLGLLERAVDLLDEALGLKDSSFAQRRAYIDPKVIEELLILISRRRKGDTLAIPLLRRLELADFELPENFERFLKPMSSRSPRSSHRSADLDRWRNFLR